MKAIVLAMFWGVAIGVLAYYSMPVALGILGYFTVLNVVDKKR